MKKRVYFGHPINTYNTELEKFLLQKISEAFQGWEIENPNQPHHQEGYQYWKETTGNGMDYFYKEVLPYCQAGIFLPFRDGKWGAGVFGEAKFIEKARLPLDCIWRIWRITTDGAITLIENIKSVPVLSIEETRQRIRDENGNPKPY